MGLGFELSESMTGTFHLFDAPLEGRLVRITLRLRVDGLRRFARKRVISAQGVIVAGGLAENGGAGRTARGTIAWRLLDENRIPYSLAFEGDDGKRYHLRGQRDFFVYNVIGSLSTMDASFYDEEAREIGRAVLRFEPSLEIPALLRSFRPKLRLKNWFRADDDEDPQLDGGR